MNREHNQKANGKRIGTKKYKKESLRRNVILLYVAIVTCADCLYSDLAAKQLYYIFFVGLRISLFVTWPVSKHTEKLHHYYYSKEAETE